MKLKILVLFLAIAGAAYAQCPASFATLTTSSNLSSYMDGKICGLVGSGAPTASWCTTALINLASYIDSTAQVKYECTANLTWTAQAKTGVDINSSGQVTASHFASPLPRAQGGLNSNSAGTGILRDGSTPAASELSGDVATSGSNVTTIQANAVTTGKINSNAVTSAKLSVEPTRRTVCLPIGANNGSALADADLGPQSRQYFLPWAGTLVEMEVAADAGTPNIIMGRSRAGSIVNSTSAALSTASAGGIACANTGGGTGLDGATTCSSTLINPSWNVGDWVVLVSGTAGGTAKQMTACLTFVTVN